MSYGHTGSNTLTDHALNWCLVFFIVFKNAFERSLSGKVSMVLNCIAFERDCEI